MSQVTSPNEGLPYLLNNLARSPLVTDEALSVRLYKNDYTPVYGSVLADFEECDFVGYTRRVIARADWTAPVLDGNSARTSRIAGAFTYTNGGAGDTTIYGCYLVGGLSNRVYYARRFTPPRVIVYGGQLLVLPSVVLRSELVD